MNNEFTRFSKKVVQYFWDPLPRNDDESTIWCLGKSYESPFHTIPAPSAAPPFGTSPIDSEVSHADSGVVTVPRQKAEETSENGQDALGKSYGDLTRIEEEMLGWPPEFLDDLESRIWLTYRNNIPAIARSQDPAATSLMSFGTKLRNLANTNGFTSDTGWGCMIRSGQSLLANTLSQLQLGRDWRKGQQSADHKSLLSLFADSPEAPFSLHKFVEHGAQACGKHPGEWFGPSATARCLQALTNKYDPAELRVYARPDDGDVYADSLIATASTKDADDIFRPTLIVLGVRLGIDRITPVYHAALKAALEMPQSVGIAGGRPSSSHYFIGHQADQFFYLDPHSTRSALPAQLSDEDVETCHTRRVRRIPLNEMDPSMLIGFLIKSKDDFEDWRRRLETTPGKAIVHIHDTEPRYQTGIEREGAVDDVEAWDETGDEIADDVGVETGLAGVDLADDEDEVEGNLAGKDDADDGDGVKVTQSPHSVR